MNAAAFVFAETLLAANVGVWILYAHDWRGAAVAAALMFVTYRAHLWAQQ